MEEARKLLFQEEWRIIDQSSTGLYMSALQSFAIDDALCASVGAGLSSPTARAWVHRPVVVLGIQDTKLPYLEDGLAGLKASGYEYVVRNSGGLAVVLDEGILNLTLVFPETSRKIRINRGYEAMLRLVKDMFPKDEDRIRAGEIAGSYCPGSYDVSIGGKKFAGISQRRLANGVAVQIYLCVTGSGSARAKLLKDFYARAKKDAVTKFAYPDIHPAVMASLSELLERPLTVEEAVVRFFRALKKNSRHLSQGSLTGEEQVLYEKYLARMAARNEKGLPSV